MIAKTSETKSSSISTSITAFLATNSAIRVWNTSNALINPPVGFSPYNLVSYNTNTTYSDRIDRLEEQKDFLLEQYDKLMAKYGNELIDGKTRIV